MNRCCEKYLGRMRGYPSVLVGELTICPICRTKYEKKMRTWMPAIEKMVVFLTNPGIFPGSREIILSCCLEVLEQAQITRCIAISCPICKIEWKKEGDRLWISE